MLVVEDDIDILSSLAEVIREEGFEVRTAANGYQALAAFEEREPAVIFLDLMMPLMDGWKFLSVLRQRHPHTRAQVILLSAVRNLEDQARRLGVSHFLVKPFHLEQVVRLAHACCGSLDTARHVE